MLQSKPGWHLSLSSTCGLGRTFSEAQTHDHMDKSFITFAKSSRKTNFFDTHTYVPIK